MKKQLITIVFIIPLFFACKKEVSYENKDAEGSLKDSAGFCFSILSFGEFKRGSEVPDSNYVQVQLNIKRRGYYKVYTNFNNGISFSDSGYITEGLKTIKLKPTGRPLLAEATTFAVIFKADTCYFTLPVVAAAGDPATFTLLGTPDKCLNAQVEGEYKVNAALTSANKVIIQVDVKTIGKYSFSSSANGISFSADGTFTSTGVKQVILSGNGTPTAAGINNFNLSGSTSQCNFSIDVQPIRISAINKADTAWSFNVGATKFFGPFDQAYTSGAAGAKFLYLKGITVLGDSAMSISIQLPRAVIDTGTYFTNTNPHFTFQDRYALTGTIFRADPSTTSVEMKVIITSFDKVTGLIEGTFSGTATSETGPVAIVGGRFKAEVD